jgi:V8-like Glu-specific endopeptidase
MLKRIGLVSFLFLFVSCNTKTDDSDVKIIGGQVDNNYEAVVQITRNKTALCSAVFVSHNVALTAAHCVDAEDGITSLSYKSDSGDVFYAKKF